MPTQAQDLPDRPQKNGIDLELTCCDGCGLYQLLNPSVPYFREVIRATSLSEKMTRFRLAQFRQWGETRGLEHGRIFEAGCGTGENLAILRQALPHADVLGMEYGEKAVATALRNGANVVRTAFETGEEKLPDGPFDGCFSLNFLEHQPSVRHFLKGIANNLTENGRGLLEVPNSDRIFEQGLFSELIIDHLCYFQADSFRRILEINGFDVLDLQTTWGGYILSAEVQKRPRPDVTRLRLAQDRLFGKMQELLSRFPADRVAVWGASHQCFSLLAHPSMLGRVACIIDSAPFKQGKYAPASGTPIIAPEQMKDFDPAIIIIIAGNYNSEIAETIRKRHDRPGLVIYMLEDNNISEYR